MHPVPHHQASVSAGRLPRASGGRLWGLDLARTVALLAMAATHTLPLYTITARDGVDTVEPTWTALLFSGRASVLFAVLAGAALVLMRNKSILYLWTRSALLILIGIGLEFLETGVYVILVPLAIAMAVTALVRRWRVPSLTVLAVLWLGLAPWVQQWIDRHAADPASGWWRRYAQLQEISPESWFAYPLVIWLGYTLLGAALMAWLKPPTGAKTSLRVSGMGAATLWTVVTGALLLAVALLAAGAHTVGQLATDSVVSTGLWTGAYDPEIGTATALWELDQFQWLPTPHSSAAFAVWQHAAVATAVVVAAASLPRLRSRPQTSFTSRAALTRPSAWLGAFGALGRWSLSTYVWHLIVLAAVLPYELDEWADAAIVFAAMGLLGIVAVVAGGRGPLEGLIAAVSGRVEALLSRRSS